MARVRRLTHPNVREFRGTRGETTTSVHAVFVRYCSMNTLRPIGVTLHMKPENGGIRQFNGASACLGSINDGLGLPDFCHVTVM